MCYSNKNKENIDENIQKETSSTAHPQENHKDKNENKIKTRASISSIDSDLPLIMNPLRNTYKASTQTAKFKSPDSQKENQNNSLVLNERKIEIIKNLSSIDESDISNSIERVDTINSEKILNFEFESFKQHTLKLQKQIEEVKEKQFASTKQWKEKETRYLQIIESFKNKEFDEWNNTYTNLISKVENLKIDIDNIKSEDIDNT